VNIEDRSIHSNIVEGYFSIFKRGMKGIYQHCSEQHLQRHLAEYEFRNNNRARARLQRYRPLCCGTVRHRWQAADLFSP